MADTSTARGGTAYTQFALSVLSAGCPLPSPRCLRCPLRCLRRQPTALASIISLLCFCLKLFSRHLRGQTTSRLHRPCLAASVCAGRRPPLAAPSRPPPRNGSPIPATNTSMLTNGGKPPQKASVLAASHMPPAVSTSLPESGNSSLSSWLSRLQLGSSASLNRTVWCMSFLGILNCYPVSLVLTIPAPL